MSSSLKALEIIGQRKVGYALPGEVYSDKNVYLQDLDKIWHKEWVFAGHTIEIPKAGEYITLQVGNYPVVIVRDSKNEVRAFHNACRHRGSRICSEAKGKTAKLVCPYHTWTFDLDGKLLYAANMGESFNNDDHNLLPVHCEVINTFIYICVAETAPDFSSVRRDVTPFIAPHDLENCKVAYESTIVENGNWKLVFENNRECYHCDANHPELLRSFQENPSVGGTGDIDDPELLAHWNKCEDAGLPSQLVMADDGQYRMTRIPLTGESVSYTMDGKVGVADSRLDTSGVEDIGALLYFLYPSTWNHFLGDHVLSFRVLPLSSGETLVTTKWLVHKDAEEGKDYDIDRLTAVWIATNNQDKRLVEETQLGVTSPTYTPGPFSTGMETGVCQFVDWYCATMKAKLSE